MIETQAKSRRHYVVCPDDVWDLFSRAATLRNLYQGDYLQMLLEEGDPDALESLQRLSLELPAGTRYT